LNFFGRTPTSDTAQISLDTASAAALPQVVSAAHAAVRMIFDFFMSEFKSDDDYRELWYHFQSEALVDPGFFQRLYPMQIGRAL
jgi:hypothetical protein